MPLHPLVLFAGQYSAVPPPSALEPKKGKGLDAACKKTDSSGIKEQSSGKKKKKTGVYVWEHISVLDKHNTDEGMDKEEMVGF